MNRPININMYMRLDEINSVCTDAGLICNYDLTDKEWFHKYCQNNEIKMALNDEREANYGNECIVWSIKPEENHLQNFKFLSLMLKNVPQCTRDIPKDAPDEFSNITIYPYVVTRDDVLCTNTHYDKGDNFECLNFTMNSICGKYQVKRKEHRNKYLVNGADAVELTSIEPFKEIVGQFVENWRLADEQHTEYLFKRALGLTTFTLRRK